MAKDPRRLAKLPSRLAKLPRRFAKLLKDLTEVPRHLAENQRRFAKNRPRFAENQPRFAKNRPRLAQDLGHLATPRASTDDKTAVMVRPVERDDSILVPAVLRGVVLAVLAGGSVTAFDLISDDVTSWMHWARALGAIAVGAVLAATSLVELLAARWRPSVRRDALALALAAIVALGVSFVVVVQTDYTYYVTYYGSPSRALLCVRTELANTAEFPLGTLQSLTISAAPFLPALLLRLRGRGLVGQLLANVVGSGAVAYRALEFDRACGLDMVYILGAFALRVLLEPISCALVARFRSRSRVETDAAQPAGTPSSSA